MFPMIMSNVTWLDTNNDGYWSIQDDIDGLSQENSEHFGKGGSLMEIFRNFMKEAEANDFQHQINRKLPFEESKDLTEHFSRIPMSWMHEEQSIIDLCNSADPALCGNLEIRGTLKHIGFPGESPQDRVDGCRDTYDKCLRIFGEIYRSYTKFLEQSCGDKSSVWMADEELIVSRYSRADQYDPKSNKNAIPTLAYESFLFLVLVIWWLIVIAEMRVCLAWWFVIASIPSEDGTVVKDDGENICIESIGFISKIVVELMVLLPRTIIILLLAWIGTDFLIMADNYSDLILNSVALSFVSEVDDMLFCALTSQKTKQRLERTKPLSGQHRCCNCCKYLEIIPISIQLVLFVLAMAYFQMSLGYEGRHGKLDLSGAFSCLCHMEGAKCVSAQLLGGADRIPSELLG
jgi:hypothetical protein